MLCITYYRSSSPTQPRTGREGQALAAARARPVAMRAPRLPPNPLLLPLSCVEVPWPGRLHLPIGPQLLPCLPHQYLLTMLQVCYVFLKISSRVRYRSKVFRDLTGAVKVSWNFSSVEMASNCTAVYFQGQTGHKWLLIMTGCSKHASKRL